MPLLLVVSLLLVLAMCVLATMPIMANRYNAIFFASPLMVAAILGVALWNNPVYDRRVYARQLELLREAPAPWKSEYFGRDPLFSVYLWLVGRLEGHSPALLFGLTAVILLGAYLVACWMVGLPSWAIAGALVTFVLSGYFAAYTGVAVRQGLGLAALLVAIGVVIHHGRLDARAVPLLLAAGLLHWSAAVFAVCLALVAILRPSVKVMFLGWATCFVLGVTGVAQLAVSRLGLSMVDAYSSYSSYENYGRTGLRLDFVALSAILAIVSYAVTTRWPTPQGRWLSITFLAFNSLYLILGYVAFSDRVAVYSLALVPMAAWYAISVVQRTRSTAIPVIGLLSGVAVLGLLSGQWQMLSAWW